MAKIVTMGEIMLRLSTPFNQKLIQATQFDACYGGGEANVAVALANFGHDAEFVTKLPTNALGDSVLAVLRKMNIDTKNIVRGGDRLGIYFLEPGAAVRPSAVTYDRAHSSFSEATAHDFDFDKIFDGADWFHFTGITPALSDSAAELTEAALKAAKAKGVTVSVDFNYRKSLWSEEKAHKVMKNLMQYVDVCIDGERLLGYKPSGADDHNGNPESAGYPEAFREMSKDFGFKYIIGSLRVSHSASDNSWSACIYSTENDEFYHSREYRISPIVDRIGGGDAFVGGFICGILDGRDFKSALEFGVASSILKHTIPGDYNLASREEVEGLMGGSNGGRVQR